ncbi:hypothetical protein [Burkholderia metallica]
MRGRWPAAAHPVDPAVRARLMTELAEVEHDREYKRPWGDVAMLDAFLRDVVDGR